jgi:DNA-binding CsgD family transcriptional regulator
MPRKPPAPKPDPAAAATAPQPKPASPPAARLKLSAVRRAFRLIGEVRERGHDPHAWRMHLVRKLCKLVNAEVVVASEFHFLATRTPGMMRVVDLGWGSDVEGNVWEIRTEREDATPESYKVVAAEGGAPAAAAGPSTTDPKTEDTPVPVRPAQPVYGGTYFVMSQVPVPHANAIDRLAAHRIHGQAVFTPPEHRLLRLIHVELGRLWRRDAIHRAGDPKNALPPRMKQTLDELLAGASEKQIAAKLGISPHTVHNYVKALHQRFEVSSRGELLAKLGKQQAGDFTPRLGLS